MKTFNLFFNFKLQLQQKQIHKFTVEEFIMANSNTNLGSVKSSDSEEILGNSCTKFSVTVYNPKDRIQSMGGSEITVKEFLDFLKTAYQVQDSLEGVLLENGMPEAVDWIKLKESELVKPKNVGCQTSEAKLRSDEKKGKVCSNFRIKFI